MPQFDGGQEITSQCWFLLKWGSPLDNVAALLLKRETLQDGSRSNPRNPERAELCVRINMSLLSTGRVGEGSGSRTLLPRLLAG
jgi:hypothetical protein